jgi:DNA-binding NarL/FixJ family response regulator
MMLGQVAECLELRTELGYAFGLAECLDVVAAAAIVQGDVARAAELLAAASALCERIGVSVAVADRAAFEADVASARARLGEAAFDEAWMRGVRMTTDEAVASARELCELARTRSGVSAVPGPKAVREVLSARELEVAGLIGRGLTNAAIAEALVISERTVHRHVGNILDKLDVRSRSQVAIWAVERGLKGPNSG